ncbi:MAG: uroporphyrinogen-III C-methyltransferase [Rhodanobacter sp.]
MSTTDTPTPAPEGARPHPSPTAPSPSAAAATRARGAPGPAARGGGTLALALLLSLLAVIAAGYVGWQQWQQIRHADADSAGLVSMQQRVNAVESTLAAVSGERTSLDQRLGDAAQVNRALREELLGQSERTRHLEDAVAKLAEKTLSGRDPLLLDETESLLRMGAERYRLFNDVQGAQAAYAIADQTLAAVNDGAFSPVRQSISAESDALAKSQPATLDGALQRLQALRGSLASLPLKSLDGPVATTDATVWSRIKRALAGVITVQRDHGAPLAVADARFARELTALDIAQAQVALLAHDRDAYASALQRVDASLASQFDANAADVRQARGTLQGLRAALPTTAPVTLGAALTELRNLRAVHALAPASGSSTAPVPSASVGETTP